MRSIQLSGTGPWWPWWAILLALVVPAEAGAKSSPERCRAPLRLEVKNAVLQRNLAARLEAQGWSKALQAQALSVAVVDLTDPKRPYYAGINDDHMMYAASVPKIGILLTVIEEVNAGRIKWAHAFDRRLQNMIVASSNPDASWATDLVGLLAIERTVRHPKYCFYDDTHGGLWVGRAYRSGGASNRDPLFNISHGATARQVARFYAMLNEGKLVSPHWSFRMLGLMSPPAHHHKFVAGLGKREGVVFLARKSGTWRNYHGDSALIQRFDRRYVLVGLSELRSGETVMRELAQVVDTLIEEGSHRRTTRRRSMSRK